MSTASAQQFVKKMMEDKAFAEKVENLNSKEERAAFIKQEGLDFTQADLVDAASEFSAVDVVGGDCCGVTCESENLKYTALVLKKIHSDAKIGQTSSQMHKAIMGGNLNR